MRGLQRITWRDGQRLSSDDFRDDERLHDRHRELHIRYLHKTWGIVEGLQVQAAGGAAVFTRPGYALTSNGEEIISPRAVTIQAPPGGPVPVTYYVVISPPVRTACVSTSMDLSQLCPGAKAPMSLQKGVVSWKTVTQVRLGVDILLARMAIADGQVVSIIDLSVANRAIPRSQRSWSDTTPSGNTGWKTGNGLLQARIEFSDAGFVAPPVCFAQIVLPKENTYKVRGYIGSISSTGFDYLLRPATLPEASQTLANDLTPDLAESAGWTVLWTAIEVPRTNLIVPIGDWLGKLK